MKKFFKVFAIVFSSLLLVVIIAVAVVCNVIFSPSKLTPLVRNFAGDYITCDFGLDTVDLTFFSSFPDFSIHVTNLKLINDSVCRDNDTLASISDLYASVNLKEFVFNNNVVVNKVALCDSKVNVFVDSTGRANYDVFEIVSDSTDEDTSDSASLFSLFEILDVEKVVLDGINATYVDCSSGMDLRLHNLCASLKARLENADGNIKGDVGFDRAVAVLSDSTAVFADVNKCRLKLSGDMKDNHFAGDVSLSLPENTFALNSDTLLNDIALNLDAPLEFNFDLMMLKLKNSVFSVNDFDIGVDGLVQLQDNKNNINLDINFKTNAWGLEDLLAIVPDCYRGYIEDLSASGNLSLSGSASGVYSNDSYPVLAANIQLDDANVDYPVIPYSLSDINTDLRAVVDMNDGAISSVNINSLSLKADDITLSASGKVNDVLGKMLCDIKLKGSLDLDDLKPLLPDDLPVLMNGGINADVKAAFALQDAMDLKLDRIAAVGNIEYSGLNVAYNDSIRIKDNHGLLSVRIPSPDKDRNKSFKELLQVELDAEHLKLQADNMALNTDINHPTLKVGLGNFLDTTQFISVNCNFDLKRLKGSMDTISFDIVNPSGNVVAMPSGKNRLSPSLKIKYNSSSLDVKLGSLLALDTKSIDIDASADYDESGSNFLAQWNPNAFVDFNQGNIKYSPIASSITVPEIKFRFRPNDFEIDRSRIVIDDSDFNLSGIITNLKNYVTDQGLLRANLDFISEKTNIDQLMALVNGFGNSDTDTVSGNTDYNAQETDSLNTDDDGPFMVPKGVSVVFNTSIKNAIFNSHLLRDVNGKLTVRDGVAIVEQMGFTSDAAEMQLTGLYRSDRRNHLFCGLDFHLLKIDIKELINLIPAVDTIVPMLKSFEGKAEFHLAAETYLNSKYEPKMSTLRAAAALEGKDLVLLDSETFSTIAKYLMFSKKTRNIVDSLSVEMTVFRNEIDIYPFLISMDKWQAVLSGRHTLDNRFNYHISLTDCPLPVRLGLDVKGTFDDMKFKLVPCQYKALYKPEKRKPTDERILSLKKLISDALKDNVK